MTIFDSNINRTEVSSQINFTGEIRPLAYRHKIKHKQTNGQTKLTSEHTFIIL